MQGTCTYSVHAHFISEDLLSKYQTGRRIPHYENSHLHYPYAVLCTLQQPPALSCTSGEWSRLNQFAVSLLQHGRHYPLKLHDPSSLPLSLCCWTIAARITVVTVLFFYLFIIVIFIFYLFLFFFSWAIFCMCPKKGPES